MRWPCSTGWYQTPTLTRLIWRLRPDRLLGWDPWRRCQLHLDHRVPGLATLDAALAAGNLHWNHPEQLADGLTAHRVEEVYLFVAEEPDTRVDIMATFERKLATIACHRSQVEGLHRGSRDCGRQCGCAYAEGFKVLLPSGLVRRRSLHHAPHSTTCPRARTAARTPSGPMALGR